MSPKRLALLSLGAMVAAQAAILAGPFAAVFALALPALLWALVMRMWQPKSRVANACQFACWPGIVISSQLAAPVAEGIELGFDSYWWTHSQLAVINALLCALVLGVILGVGYFFRDRPKGESTERSAEPGWWRPRGRSGYAARAALWGMIVTVTVGIVLSIGGLGGAPSGLSAERQEPERKQEERERQEITSNLIDEVLDEILDREQEPETPAVQRGRNPYAEDLERERRERNRQLAISFKVAVEGDPDFVAQATQFAGPAGIDRQLVERNVKRVREFVRRKQLTVEVAGGVLAEMFRDPMFVRIAHDDVPNLTALEKGWQLVKQAVQGWIGLSILVVPIICFGVGWVLAGRRLPPIGPQDPAPKEPLPEERVRAALDRMALRREPGRSRGNRGHR